MIVERVIEFVIDEDSVAEAFYDEYQDFIDKNEGADYWDFANYIVEDRGLDAVLDEINNAQVTIVSERFF